MPKTKAPTKTQSPQTSDDKTQHSEVDPAPNPTTVFVSMALDMSWRLAIVVLLPIIAGFKLDEHFKLTPLLTITGFLLAMAGTAIVMWTTLQEANQLPAPKANASKKEKQTK
jgi:F0F1-type ATP synthase assembly protein I